MRYKTLLTILAAAILATLAVRSLRHKDLPASSAESPKTPADSTVEASREPPISRRVWHDLERDHWMVNNCRDQKTSNYKKLTPLGFADRFSNTEHELRQKMPILDYRKK